MPSYKLTYFNGRGRGEGSRFMFAIGDIEYEDERIEKRSDEWAKLKPDTPFGQLPMLNVDGEVICQQRAIEGFIARKVGLAGKSDLEFARCQMIGECIEDTYKCLEKTFILPVPEKLAAKEEFTKNGVKEFLVKFEKLLSPEGYFLGKSLSWPDISLANIFQCMPSMGVSETDLHETISKFPRIMACVKQVENHPKCKAWMEKRPITSF